MAKPGDGNYYATVPLTSASKGTRLALSTVSAALTAADITAGMRYEASLTHLSSDAGFFKFASSVALPADNAVETEGFWLMPGETKTVEASSNQIAGILISGTGTLLMTRIL